MKLYWLYIVIMLCPDDVELCSKSPNFYYRHYRVRSHVFVHGEYQPVDLENSRAASGPVDRSDYVNVVPNKKLVRFDVKNVKILFDNEKARWMTKMMRKKLINLQHHIQNQWPNRAVFIQVHESWNPRNYRRIVGPLGTERHQMSTMSQYHWAGRAVDMSLISSGYVNRDIHPGKLAQLAFYSAKFDWCIYKSVNFCHCSVTRDSAMSQEWYGCFPNNARIFVEEHQRSIELSLLKIGDTVITITKEGLIRRSPVIGFFHRDTEDSDQFVEIHTSLDRHTLVISQDHLIYRLPYHAHSLNITLNESFIFQRYRETTFASSIKEGDFIFTIDNQSSSLKIYKVTKVIKYIAQRGKIAPLTRDGSILINDVFVSCISSFKTERYSMMALTPYISLCDLWTGATGLLDYYTTFLVNVANLFLPHYFYQET